MGFKSGRARLVRGHVYVAWTVQGRDNSISLKNEGRKLMSFRPLLNDRCEGVRHRHSFGGICPTFPDG